jgi:hypothetical protein
MKPVVPVSAWCRAVAPRSLLTLARDARYVYSNFKAETFWVGATEKRTTWLEKYVLQIFHAHAAAAGYTRESLVAKWGPKSVGAEWWVQNRTTDFNSIDWHFDEDQEFYRKSGLTLSPWKSTVTYLSDFGAPTVLFSQPRLGQYSDGTELEGLGPDSDVDVYISHPVVGKHVAFDGRSHTYTHTHTHTNTHTHTLTHTRTHTRTHTHTHAHSRWHLWMGQPHS